MLNLLSAIVASSDDDGGGAAAFTPLILIALIFVAMYFLMIRPQRRRLREQQDMQRAIGEGDEVLTTSGVYGFVTAIDGEVVWLEIAENVEIRIAKGAIARVVDQAEETATDEDADADVDDDDESADS
jgi:preprotein translocase subunit YajC